MKTKLEKGITLVALIITIIVLLILAVVAIGSVNNTGVIQYAQNSVEKYGDSQDKENVTLQNYIDILEYHNTEIKDTPKETASIIGYYELREDDGEIDVAFKFMENGKGIFYRGHEIDQIGEDGKTIYVWEVEEFNFTYDDNNIILGNNRITGKDPGWDKPIDSYTFSIQTDENTGKPISKTFTIWGDSITVELN